MKLQTGTALLLITFILPGVASASIGSKVIKETAELLVRRGGKEIAEETVETLAKKMTLLGARYGDDLVTTAFKRVGPRAARIASEAGEHGSVALRLLGRHGDDAVRIATRSKALQLAAKFGDDVAEPLIRHGDIGEKLIERFGADGAEALSKLSPQNVRRLAMLVEEQGDKVTPGLIQMFAKHGHADTLAQYVWRNKGALFLGATLATFVASPEPFLNAAETVTTRTLDSAVQPMVAEAARQFPWGLTAWGGLTVALIVLVARFGVPRSLKHGAGVVSTKLRALKSKSTSHSVPPSKDES